MNSNNSLLMEIISYALEFSRILGPGKNSINVDNSVMSGDFFRIDEMLPRGWYLIDHLSDKQAGCPRSKHETRHVGLRT